MKLKSQVLKSCIPLVRFSHVTIDQTIPPKERRKRGRKEDTIIRTKNGIQHSMLGSTHTSKTPLSHDQQLSALFQHSYHLHPHPHPHPYCPHHHHHNHHNHHHNNHNNYHHHHCSLTLVSSWSCNTPWCRMDICSLQIMATNEP